MVLPKTNQIKITDQRNKIHFNIFYKIRKTFVLIFLIFHYFMFGEKMQIKELAEVEAESTWKAAI